ncbi:putative hydrogenase 2 b cytochrome subunit [Salinivirga cyanobacteriivorans]|uniref:Putative hydrogenase 2 b cytochrome subunit n=1 Tax=Salinivirga cyanobacteriivorans TaxID=1307839 RepID=A0A0S2I4Q7_9BACT|nr:NrfD/PsrC family molybdoenzyme membrane anchor subunit [Salinivirga cyanobacteriivorans]ALO17179.1 putative hydrogenase 2 b cytochrome subunit [Salinivirga cyanobacteriivorans]
MSSNSEHQIAKQETIDKVAADALRPVNIGWGFKIWFALLAIALGVCIYAYSIQLREGLGVTGLRDFISWGMYIATFVFFVAASLIGMLISGVLGLIGYDWIKPIGRIAEIIAVAFAAIAGLVIVSDMGRPDRLPFVFMYGRFQSPILWDVTVVTTYFALSLLLYYVTLLPDLAISKDKLEGRPKLLRKAYEVLSIKWLHKNEQYRILYRIIRILLILIIPTAFAIHTVTSWLFAVNPRPGWDSTIFGPYFLSGAFVAGAAAVIIAMYFFRNNYKLKDYLTISHFDKIGKLLALVSIVYLYFNINEFLVPGYKLKKFDAIHLQALFVGKHAILFWFTQITGLILPIILLFFRKMRRPIPLTVISVFVLIGAWLKRYLIVVPTQEHPYLPIQHVPEVFKVYTPTLIETAVTAASFIMVIMIITLLSKLFPVIPIWEVAEDIDKKALKENAEKE